METPINSQALPKRFTNWTEMYGLTKHLWENNPNNTWISVMIEDISLTNRKEKFQLFEVEYITEMMKLETSSKLPVETEPTDTTKTCRLTEVELVKTYQKLKYYASQVELQTSSEEVKSLERYITSLGIDITGVSAWMAANEVRWS